ncbi:MAG TPA: YraN family protein [Burkholderiales bacterium]|nr:YraN family protein [Burkholderiales bacterium]
MTAGGRGAEDAALVFLRTQGLALLARNYHCRFGEIDLVMREGAVTVFVEVRMRTSRAFGGAIESITSAKRSRLLAAARHYMAQRGDMPACRFDAVLLDGDNEPRWIRNAFGE